MNIKEMAKPYERLKSLYEYVVENNITYEENITNLSSIKYMNILLNLMEKNAIRNMDNLGSKKDLKLERRMEGTNVVMAKSKYKGKEVLLTIFQIIFKPGKTNSKDISTKIREIIEWMERAFVRLDYLRSFDSSEEGCGYVVVIKNMNGELEK